eukprot:Platyproteum_vivax@DN14036_c0_g1_i1.p1
MFHLIVRVPFGRLPVLGDHVYERHFTANKQLELNEGTWKAEKDFVMHTVTGYIELFRELCLFPGGVYTAEASNVLPLHGSHVLYLLAVPNWLRQEELYEFFGTHLKKISHIKKIQILNNSSNQSLCPYSGYSSSSHSGQGSEALIDSGSSVVNLHIQHRSFSSYVLIFRSHVDADHFYADRHGCAFPAPVAETNRPPMTAYCYIISLITVTYIESPSDEPVVPRPVKSPKVRDKSPKDKSPKDKSPKDKSPNDDEKKSPTKDLNENSPNEESSIDKSPRDKSPIDTSPIDKSPIDKSPREESPSYWGVDE